MDYKGGTELWKHQWGEIQDPDGVWFSFWQDEEDGEASWTIIDEKHTKLFNKVYDNNLNPYKSGNGICKLEEWTEEWTYSDDKPEELIAKVIQKLKDAVNGNTIAKITLRDNGIYVGKHTVGNKVYPTAIYSRKKEITNIKKIVITGLSELKDDSIKKYLYCESTYWKYLVLAFYEENETEPSLMIQAAKKEWEAFSSAHLEAWMKYVGVMEEDVVRCVTKLKDKLEYPNLPYCGDPLSEMGIVGTDENNQNNHIGGLYGCVRYTDKVSKQNCTEWTQNVTNFPTISGKNKVHDGIDLYSALSTSLYSMYNGVVESVYIGSTTDLGSYLIIKSTKAEHQLANEAETIFIAYGHLQSISVKKGDVIRQGQLIGYTGNSGNASGIREWRYHVHLQVYRINTSNKYNRVNPIDYLTTKFSKNNGNKIN
jgi:hypothetical protein